MLSLVETSGSVSTVLLVHPNNSWSIYCIWLLFSYLLFYLHFDILFDIINWISTNALCISFIILSFYLMVFFPLYGQYIAYLWNSYKYRKKSNRVSFKKNWDHAIIRIAWTIMESKKQIIMCSDWSVVEPSMFARLVNVVHGMRLNMLRWSLNLLRNTCGLRRERRITNVRSTAYRFWIRRDIWLSLNEIESRMWNNLVIWGNRKSKEKEKKLLTCRQSGDIFQVLFFRWRIRLGVLDDTHTTDLDWEQIKKLINTFCLFCTNFCHLLVKQTMKLITKIIL